MRYISKTVIQYVDSQTFEHIAPALRVSAIGTLHRMGLQEAEAQDMAQDALLRLWQLHVELMDESHAHRLVRVLVRHAAIDTLRARHTVILPVRPESGPVCHPDSRLEEAEDMEWLRRRLDRLPATQHEVLRLRQVERRTNAEIAALLGLETSSVATLLSRARRTLLEELKKRNNRQNQ